MRITSLLAFAATPNSVAGSPKPVVQYKHIVHEKWSVVPDSWNHLHRLDRDTDLPIRLAIAQSNLYNMEEYLMSVSDSASPNWNEHWSSKQIAETFAPSDETMEAVRA